MSYTDTGCYIGQMTEDQNCRQGQGIYYYPTKDIYFGSWDNDMFHGHGVYIFASGEVY